MIQQINLYQGQHSRRNWQRDPYLLSGLFSGLALILISLWSSQTLDKQQQHRQQLQQQLQQVTARLLIAQAQLPNPGNDALLNQELQQTQLRYQNLAHIVELLGDQQSDQALGFSAYLSALTEQADSRVWISRIKINAASQHISLHGSSFQAEQIPALLQRLQSTDAFKNRRFARLSIEQSTQIPQQVDFTVSSSLADSEDADSH